jgi:hypothetical protein
MLPHNNEGMKYSELIRFSFKYPPLLFPVLDFQKMWRRKMFGERFWSERVAEPHSRPTAYEDARSKFGIPSEDFNLFARIPTTKAAWRHTAKNITLDLMANMSSTKTPPPWEQVSKPIARTVLKNHFGYQKAYFFIELLDMRDEAQIEEIERVKASALEKGMFCYDEWLKADFFHNPITGISEVRGQRGVKGEGEGEEEGGDNSNPQSTQPSHSTHHSGTTPTKQTLHLASISIWTCKWDPPGALETSLLESSGRRRQVLRKGRRRKKRRRRRGWRGSIRRSSRGGGTRR